MRHKLDENRLSQDALDIEVKRVEKILEENISEGGVRSIKKLVHSLQVYQEELTLQNIELERHQQESDILREYYYTLFNLLPLPAVYVDERLHVVDSNQAAKNTFRSETISLGITNSLMKSLSRDSIQLLYNSIRSNTYPIYLEVQGNNQDVQIFYDLVLTKLNDCEDEGKFLIVFKDTTIEQKLKEKNAIFLSVLNSSSDSIISLDMKGSVKEYSRNLCQYTVETNNENIIESLPLPIKKEIDNYIEHKVKLNVRHEKTIEVIVKNVRHPLWLRIQLFPVEESGIIVGTGCIISNHTEFIKQEKEISNLAYYDHLTNCGNRRLLRLRVSKLISQVDNPSFTMFFVDLDHFKDINDIYGHNVGDEMLVQVASRLKKAIRPFDELFRVGGDEFLILFHQLPTEMSSDRAYRIIEILSAPFIIDDKELASSASIGISRFPEDGTDFISLYKKADTALYKAKKNGRKRFRFFSETMLLQIKKNFELEENLRKAMAKNEFSTELMPQIRCSDSTCQNVELLLRWNNEVIGLVPPNDFIPVAERSELIHTITEFVIEDAINKIKALNKFSPKKVNISVNISKLDILNAHFFEIMKARLDKDKKIAKQLTFELTESVFSDSYTLIVDRLNQLKLLGVSISIDDFGTGYSSLSQLSELPIDELKIDKSFISKLGSDESDKKICLAILSMAKSLGYRCVAEGVESEEQFNWLASIFCDYSQGYFHSKPITFKDFISRYV
jgi:diguanylate cyclase (GGDEF)-like protein